MPTLREQRAKIIKDRANKLKSDAKKQGISVEELKQKRSDTYSTVLSPLTFLPFGRALSLAGKGTSRLKKLFDSSKAAKAPKTSTNTTKLSKTSKTKPSNTTKTTKTTKSNKKTKVTPTTVTKPKQGPFPKVYKRPIGPKPKTSTRVKNFVRKNKVPIAAGAATLGTTSALLSSKKTPAKDTKKTVFPKPKLRPKSINKKETKPNIIKSPPPMKKTNITAGGTTGFGPKGNIFASSEKRRKELMEKYGGTGSAAARAAMKGTQGNMVKRAAGGLKPVPEGNKGLGKLPQPVRNKMGYMKKGGVVKMRGGGAATRGMNFNRGY